MGRHGSVRRKLFGREHVRGACTSAAEPDRGATLRYAH